MSRSWIRLGPLAYDHWRATRLGALTEEIEHTLLWEMAGDPAGLRFLDVGCGDGALARQAAARGALAVGLDPDPDMLAAARQQALAQGSPAQWLGGEAQRLPLGDASCGLVLAVTVLCFLPQDEAVAALAEMARVLKPGGRLVLGELSPWSLWAAQRRVRGWLGSPLWRRARFHTPAELKALARGAGLEVRGLKGAVYYPPWPWAARLLGPWDAALSSLTNLGAAFLALLAVKPAKAGAV